MTQPKIDGFELGGQSVTNDVIIKVEAVGTGGGITYCKCYWFQMLMYPIPPSYTTTTVSGVDADLTFKELGLHILCLLLMREQDI